MKNILLYQAYGTIDHVNECRYSLLKYLQLYNLIPPANIGIYIYTDQPAWFEEFSTFFSSFEIHEISTNMINQWKGEINFVHRVKVEILIDFFKYFSGNILYLDTDTYLQQPVDPLFGSIGEGTFIMHEYEGVINQKVNPQFRKWENFLAITPIHYNNKHLEFSSQLEVWNAGVIGLNSNHKEVLEDVLSLTDNLYRKFPKHIAEQFAFSYCFRKEGEVRSSMDSIFHYWDMKEFRNILNKFFEKNTEESIPSLVKLAHHIDAAEIHDEKQTFLNLSIFKKLQKTLAGKAWKMEDYEKKL
jgi:hypothetical protein